MALPICIEIPEIPDPFDLTLPGGINIEHINLMEVIQPALTPLVPSADWSISVLATSAGCAMSPAIYDLEPVGDWTRADSEAYLLASARRMSSLYMGHVQTGTSRTCSLWGSR